MSYLRFASWVFVLGGLFLVFNAHGQPPNDCFKSSIPKFSSALFSASVDVVGHHMSGLLFVKTMPDSSRRAVFSNEGGITYFDFGWQVDGEFKVYQVIKRLKRKVVLNTLRKDFELVLIPPAIVKSIEKKEGNGEYSAVRKKERLIFKTDSGCHSIASIDVMGKKSKLVNVRFFPEEQNIPDSVSIVHSNFNMKIGLKRLAQ